MDAEISPLRVPLSLEFSRARLRVTNKAVSWAEEHATNVYLRKGETEHGFEARVHERLMNAGYHYVYVHIKENVAAYTAIGNDHRLLVIRGSEVNIESPKKRKDTWLDWKRNLQILFPRKVAEDVELMRGFSNEWDLIEEDVRRHLHPLGAPPSTGMLPLVVIGHSKGSAIGGIASYHLGALLLITCGSPRWIKRLNFWKPFQRPAWVEKFRRQTVHWRIIHAADPVTGTPGPWRNCHDGSAIVIGKGDKAIVMTEWETVKARMQVAGKELGKLALTPGVTAKTFLAIKLLVRMYKGSMSKHPMASYQEITKKTDFSEVDIN